MCNNLLLVRLITQGELDVMKESIWAASNMCSGGLKEQLDYLVENGVIQAFVGGMDRIGLDGNGRLVTVVLEGFDCLLKKCAGDRVRELIEELDCLDKVRLCFFLSLF